MCGALLFWCHKELRAGRPTSTLALALSFLYKEYEARLYWWELVVMSTKLVLVGFLSQLNQGSLMQAVVGLTASLASCCSTWLHSPFIETATTTLARPPASASV